jgi:hypothetical protein
MSWHAVDAVDDAVDATRRFLFPFGLVRWTKLGFLVLLMSGVGGGVSASANASVSTLSDTGVISPGDTGVISPGGIGSLPTGAELSSAGIDPGPVTLGELIGDLDPGVLAVAAVGVVTLIAAFSVVSLSLRLVFYDALRTNEVRVRRPFLSRLRQSLGLFLFTTVLSAATLLPLALVVLVGSAANATDGIGPIDSVVGSVGSLATGPTLVLGFVGAVLVGSTALALRFTYEFVVPTMIVEETGVLGGWRRLWTTLRTRPTDFAVYLVVHAVVSLGLSVAEGIAAVLAVALVATVAGLVLLVAAVALGGLGALIGTTAGAAALAVVAIVGVMVLTALVLPVRIVTRSYRIAYEVSTLGGIDRDLTLLHPDLDPRVSEPVESDAVDSPDP